MDSGSYSYSEELEAFLEAYGVYVQDVLKPAQREIRKLLRVWERPESWTKYRRSASIAIPTPVRSTRCRIKRPEQVVDKVLRKPENFPHGLAPESFRTMHDAVGVRVVVYFPSHLPLIDRELRDSDLVRIVDDDPPTAYLSSDEAKTLGLEHLRQRVKESGYRSVHYNLKLRDGAFDLEDAPVFELQVRTAIQDVWSAVEHHLGYKPGRRTHTVAKSQLRILSTLLAAVDAHFNLLYEELYRFQQEPSYAAGDPLTAEIVAAVLHEIGLACAQGDVNNIIKLLYSRGVETVAELLDLASPRRLETIRNTYRSALGRLPSNLEMVASLAALSGAGEEAEEAHRIRLQIAYRGAWDVIREDYAAQTDES